MDEIEIEILSQEFNEVLEEKNKELSSTPDWFLIGSGLKEAQPAVYNRAKLIYLQFLRFKATPFAENFEDVLQEFTAAKLQNRI